MRIALIIGGVCVGAIAIAVVTGFLLPAQHAASRSIRIERSAASVWTAISDFKGSLKWRKDLKTVEQVEVRPGLHAWKEVSTNGDALTYATLEAIPERKLVRKIVDEGLPFGGAWTFEIENKSDAVILTITENGEVYNPIYRFVSRFIIGHYASIDKYIAQLKSHFEQA